ncbi:hypothetical protein PCANC_19640 [Puccinia coronata f. sp. avenae]|uniref:Uncharacterized protein n=1 Tax=Puccinia coronata f. sp. avenae TaxID=200324 RepID=A0A2N5UHZ9_9BASI|nr:hypothetical protein PCANC_19640 [Puccinia coronata f. sp. avenae]
MPEYFQYACMTESRYDLASASDPSGLAGSMVRAIKRAPSVLPGPKTQDLDRWLLTPDIPNPPGILLLSSREINALMCVLIVPL